MDATNIKIGACSVKLDGVDIGHTKGGVSVSYEPDKVKITADKYGESALDYALKGEVWKVVVKLAESAVANIAKSIPAGTLAGASNGRLTIGRDAGFRFSTVAQELVLHPLVNASDDLSDDVVFHKAVAVESVEIPYNNDDERVIEVTFEALVDTTKSSGNYLGYVGDSTD